VAEYLAKRFPESKIYLDKIQATNWDTWKTEAIDFSQDFRWLDDDVYPEELNELSKHNCQNKLISIDLQRNPNQLIEIVKSEFAENRI